MTSPCTSSSNLNISLACHKCGVTMNDLYEVTSEDGLDGGADHHRIATKLWMTSCRHIICNKHLPGRVAFVPEFDRPRTPCVFCPSVHETTLLWIRGTDPGQHDPFIPSHIFKELESPSSRSANHEESTLKIHCRGATAAAKLFAAQTRVAVELLYNSQQTIKTLKRENELLKAKLYNNPHSSPTGSYEGCITPVSKIRHLTALGGNGSPRLTFKRPFQMSAPVTRNTRVCMPERGVLHSYGMQPLTSMGRRSRTVLEDELVVPGSPAFSTPYLRTNVLARPAASYQYPSRPSRDTPRIIEEIDESIDELDDQDIQDCYQSNKALEWQRNGRSWDQYSNDTRHG